jgi:hypothetical protein
MAKIKIFLLSLLLSGFLIVSCEQKPNKTIEYAIEDIELLLEGPIFGGSNDLQAKVAFDPSRILEASGLKREQIKDIRIKSVNLKTSESNFDLFESLVVQLTGAGSSLTTIALLNPVPRSTSLLQPEVSQKASFKEFKEGDHFYMVIDANVVDEFDDDINLTGNIVFYIDVKE